MLSRVHHLDDSLAKKYAWREKSNTYNPVSIDEYN
ncbi:unnamed protein product [Amoebophrya sp. A25]|nr:unnamed protein product [Amoebophrya sp. A25]|eukprot:GSA25T00009964001.1